MPTGYYGIPGSKRESDVTKVHYTLRGKAICGVRVRKGMEFQFCANGFDKDMIECQRCKRNQTNIASFARKFSKLTTEQVLTIKAIPGRLKHGQREALAKQYGVTFGCIKAVRGGQTWKWLQETT